MRALTVVWLTQSRSAISAFAKPLATVSEARIAGLMSSGGSAAARRRGGSMSLPLA
jgi:hypothetical protein